MLPVGDDYLNNHLFSCQVWPEAFEKISLSAASHKDHDGEVEHDDCAHEGYHGYDDHDADGHDSDNDDDDDDDNDG